MKNILRKKCNYFFICEGLVKENYGIIEIKMLITITVLLCMELILIRGQPPRQGGSPRATLDRGEFT